MDRKLLTPKGRGRKRSALPLPRSTGLHEAGPLPFPAFGPAGCSNCGVLLVLPSISSTWSPRAGNRPLRGHNHGESVESVVARQNVSRLRVRDLSDVTCKVVVLGDF